MRNKVLFDFFLMSELIYVLYRGLINFCLLYTFFSALTILHGCFEKGIAMFISPHVTNIY
ncbi:hypothetical protein GLOIN_2v1541745 [Rhizophagus irregularis DAOM 181602=DAOM 197198]|uniref:Uncharacterized protein n=1 Tax=Rhizophagus irregularis (strain DAOM 181602 / DAOM 197198 / MUCL 43194) TaxID=747089 RepID=A0A2P4QK93_RHIID|nr:hypothetical protein GLOIN_2v1541745 [Rhizophagus irregularis DAOM 181602=DAOM 197198]POG78069.1 hypothetical protein GLOIN_2v1541745 [Rhizophagus irregularis DAOM 181602=DAOM 197198]GET60767.1 hypothetical protein GLOIN_2v1541745 [Rhizophagus irregularis DAOM 181602=DAOM 197198]|eukprot:XP_025184935.1 hypothetical protein GLOIN_2v1541745 [Rhizophagus irregularis DAOM 181602=DAOM 197198]